MLNKDGIRELCYVATIDKIEPIEGADNIELARVGGWTLIVKKGEFLPNDLGIFFEIDSKLPEAPWSEFLAPKKYKVKTYKLGKFGVISQGLILPASAFGWELTTSGQFAGDCPLIQKPDGQYFVEGDFLTKELGVTYATEEDNKRKASVNPDAQINAALARHPKIAKKWGKVIKKNKVLRWLFLLFFGRKKDASATRFPTHFPYIHKTDQERCENMIYVLNDKTPFIVTQKCDGSSGTYILERKKTVLGEKFEFYVCSRNVRMLKPEQECFYDENFYWECAIKYDIENKLKDYLEKHPDLDYVCWQGEICAPKIQSNPQGLKETHLFCFHMIDSKQGKYDIRDAVKIWKEYGMETVPIMDENFILPDDFEEFKAMVDDKFYDPSVTEGTSNHPIEGWVLYKTDDPNFSFKNVSRKYLLKHS